MRVIASLLLVIGFSASAWSVPGQHKPATPHKLLHVVTTLAVIKALVSEIGGHLVDVASLSSAGEDPHFVKPKPTFKRLVSQADLFMQIGRSLELWVPQVLTSAGNPKLTGSGVVIVSKGVNALEVPKALTRAQGDIHPEGNPHIWLSPTASLKMAENIKDALVAKDPAHKVQYEKNFAGFKTKLAEAMFGHDLVKAAGSVDFLFRLHEGKRLKAYLTERKKTAGGWVKSTEAIDFPFITYHSVWSYFAADFGLKVFGLIEEKPGVPPSLKYQTELVKKAKADHVTHIVAASYYVGNGKLIDLIAKQIGGSRIFIDVDCRDGESYVDMMNRIIKSFLDFKNTTTPTKKVVNA